MLFDKTIQTLCMKKLSISLFCLIIISCNKSENIAKEEVSADLTEVLQEDKVASVSSPVASYASQPSDKAVSENKTPSPTQRIDTISKKIIKNGDMRIQVGDIKKSQNQINEIIKNNQAYIQKEEFQNTDIDENLYITIRVPHKNFDTLVNSFSNGVGSVLSKNISSNDVTEEYTDVSIN